MMKGSVILARMAESDSGGSIFALGRKRRGADAGTGASAVAPETGRTLSVLDVGTGVQVPEPETALPGSTNRRPGSPSYDAYSPYAEAWKEFDKLQKLAKGNHAAWFHWVWGLVIPALGILDRHRVPKDDAVWFFAFWAVVGGITLLRAQQARSRFAHWPCPRCHAEWPGTKTEKAPQCAVCGLKLHQMAP